MKVTALLVSHNGARWLPAVLAGLEAQSRPVDRAVAVDTGSTDASVSLLVEALGMDAVSSAPEQTSYGAAVRAGLDSIGSPDNDREPEWIWLLHDDSSPAPDVLETLIDAARENPSVSILGPKHREWPSLRRLLEVGITISGTGRRETGLERGEYDQGQHDKNGRCSRSTPRECWSAATCSRISAASTRGCPCSGTTSTSAGGRRGPGTAPSSCPRRWSFTSRPRTGGYAGRR